MNFIIFFPFQFVLSSEKYFVITSCFYSAISDSAINTRVARRRRKIPGSIPLTGFSVTTFFFERVSHELTPILYKIEGRGQGHELVIRVKITGSLLNCGI